MAKKKTGKQVNPELEEKLKKETVPEVAPQPQKTRVRRTRAEIEADKIAKAKAVLSTAPNQAGEFSEVGKELYTSLAFSLLGVKEKDVKDIPVEPNKPEDFEELGKSYAKVINYYTKGKMTEGGMLIFSATVATIASISGRVQKVSQIKKFRKDKEPEQILPDEAKNGTTGN